MLMDIVFERNARGLVKHYKGTYTAYRLQKLLIGIIVAFLCAAGVYFLNLGGLQLLIGVTVVGFILGYKTLYIVLLTSMLQEEVERRYMFPTFLKYFNSLITIKSTVPGALLATVDYLDEPLKSKVAELAYKLETNVEREYFIEFAEYVGGGESMMVMSMMYDFMKEGIDSDKLKDLEQMVQSMQENQINEKIVRKTRAMEKYANPPLLGVIIFVFMFAGVLFTQLMNNLNM